MVAHLKETYVQENSNSFCTSKCHPERNVSYALSPHILFCGNNQYIILSLSTSYNRFLWQKTARELILQ